MLGAYGYLIGQVDIYPRCVIVEGYGTGRKYIVALEFVPEVINCAIVLVVIVFLTLVVVLFLVLVLVLVLCFCVAAATPPPLLLLLSLDGILLIQRRFESGG